MKLSALIVRRGSYIWKRQVSSLMAGIERHLEEEIEYAKPAQKTVKLKYDKAIPMTTHLPCNNFEFSTCVELQEKACAMFGDRPVLGTKNGNKFDWMSYKELGENVQKFRNVLGSKNFKFDDKVAIISNNRAEWVVIMYATMSLGGQLVPM